MPDGIEVNRWQPRGIYAPLLPMLAGSAINIWYNITNIDPLLTGAQDAIFKKTVVVFNTTAYPLIGAIWTWLILSLVRPLRDQLAGGIADSARRLRAQRLVINLPWWGLGLFGAGWALCTPVFLLALTSGSDRLNPAVFVQLPVSFAISGLIAVTHSFFALELLAQRLLYPVFFRDSRPVETPGAVSLSLRARGILLVVAAGVCPVLSLVLLMLVPREAARDTTAFAIAVGGLGIALGIATAWLLALLVTAPVDGLPRPPLATDAADLGVRIPYLRADEFWLLIAGFNTMVAGLREKRRVEDNFGRHVGTRIAQQILASDRGLGGVEEEITIMFVDIRDFTTRSEASTPAEAVSVLNLFLAEMVDAIEQQHGGIVNKFLGDGLMALFGEWTGRVDHADAAVAAGQEMLGRLERINVTLQSQGAPPLAIGIGIHTGRAVVGSIGSPRRMEYTAIGDAVNVASRVESLTKVVKQPLLITKATYEALRDAPPLEPLPPQHVKGHNAPVEVLHLAAP